MYTIQNIVLNYQNSYFCWGKKHIQLVMYKNKIFIPQILQN